MKTNTESVTVMAMAKVSTGYTCHPGLTYIFIFWHSGTLAISPSAKMSEIKKCRFDLDGIEHLNVTIWHQCTLKG